MKEETIKFLKTLPDDISMQDIMYHLYIKKTILQRSKELKEGKIQSITDKDAKEEIEKWLH